MATNYVIASPVPSRSRMRRDLLAATLTGQAAGLLMAVAMMGLFTLFLGTTWYHPVQVMGSFVYGDGALPGTFFLPSFVAGLVIHQLIASLGWSLVFGVLINKVARNWSNVLALGLATGVFAQVVDTSVLVPALMNGLHGHDLWAEYVPNGLSLLAHLAFGLGFFLFIPVRAALPKRALR